MPGPLQSVCTAFRSRLRGLLLQAGLARMALVGVGLLAATLTLDWWLHFSWPTRCLLLLVYLAATAAVAWFSLIGPLRRRWTDREVLILLDEATSHSADAEAGMLLDLYELTESSDQIQEAGSPVGRQLTQSAVAQLTASAAAAGAMRARLAAAVRRNRVNVWLSAGGVAGLLLLLVAAVPSGRELLAIGVERLFNPFSHVRWPHRTTIALAADTPSAVPQFESLAIRAEVTGETPGEVKLFYRPAGGGKYDVVMLPVEREADQAGQRKGRATVRYTFDRVKDPLEFYLSGGDYETDAWRVAVVDKPYIKNITARYKFPRYAGIPNRVDHSPQLAGLEGTQVDVEFECSMRLARATLVPLSVGPSASSQPDSPAEQLPIAGPERTRFSRTFILRDDRSYAIQLEEEHGVRQAHEERIDIRVTPDNPPVVELLSPAAGGDLIQTNRALVDVALRATDDFGLRKVEFIYQVDSGPPIVLTDRITGPVPQEGLTSEARFSWPLRKSEIPESCTLTCFVRARDCNPLPDRGRSESARAQIKLVKPTEFHLEALERAKSLLAEARLAWLNQLQAYLAGQRFLADGSGKDEDPLWQELADKQNKAFAAGRTMNEHMRELTEQYERNQMGSEFMAGRLAPIAALINQLVGKEFPAIEDGLKSARPTAADASSQQMLAIRRSALTTPAFRDSQKRGVLLLERVLGKLYDWRDLQVATVTTTLMIERQEEVIKLTQGLPAAWVGQQKEDLGDQDLDRLLTLAKQQESILDTETGLEKQLDDLIYRARQTRRESIREPLWAAWQVLRNNRVNDYLKRAHTLIRDNQPSQVVNDQTNAIRTLRVVEAGLVRAGQKVDPDEPISLATAVQDEKTFDPELAVRRDTEAAPATSQPATEVAVKPLEVTEDPFPTVADPGTSLAAAIRAALELQDNVLARLRYLSKNSGPAEMSRFVALKWRMLTERQELAATKGLDKAVDLAGQAKPTAGDPTSQPGQQSQPIRDVLAEQHDRFAQFAKLITAKDASDGHQQMQADAIAGLSDLLQFAGLEKAVDEEAGENRRGNGTDSFGRQYLFRSEALESIVTMVGQLNYALLLQRDVDRTLQRFAKTQPDTASPLLAEVEKTNRARAAHAQAGAAGLVDRVVEKAKSPALLSGDLANRVRQTGAASLSELKLAGYVDAIASGTINEKQLGELAAAERTLVSVMQNLRESLGERVKPPLPPVASQPDEVTPEQFEKMTSRQRLAELIGKNMKLPAPVRERMLRTLAREFPAKYKDLLAAYYLSFAAADADKDKAKP